jgi:Plug domain of Sec61p
MLIRKVARVASAYGTVSDWRYCLVLQAVYTAVALFVFLVCSQLPLYGIKTNAGTVRAVQLLLPPQPHVHGTTAAHMNLRSVHSYKCGAVQAATPSTGHV